jgi:2-polyprenyl-6-hydroxyphenyl methylase/3-demethylubiquinone-9 3-methyltransferase
MRTAADEQAQAAVAYHERLAASWDERYQKPAFRARLRVLEECLAGRQLQCQEWIDAGCGAGTLARYLADKGCNVLGVDASSEMISAARQAAQPAEHPERVRFQQIETIAALPIHDSSFDGVLCSSVLEYVADAPTCLAEFHRVLRPNGLLVVSIANRRSIIRRAQVTAHRLAKVLRRKWLPFLEHSRNEYTVASFRLLLEKHGFEVERAIPFGSPIPVWLQDWEFGGSLLMFGAVRRAAS